MSTTHTSATAARVSIDALIPEMPLAATQERTVRELMQFAQHTDPQHNEFSRRTLLGFRIPNFQRGLKWSDEQKEELVISIYRGLPIGALMVTTEARHKVMQDVVHPLSNMLIDGQQRLQAINDFINDEFTVAGYTFSELDDASQARFLNSKVLFQRLVVQHFTYAGLEEVYDRYNYGGSVHEETERAVRDELELRKIVRDEETGELMVIDGYGRRFEYVSDEPEVEDWGGPRGLSSLTGAADESSDDVNFDATHTVMLEVGMRVRVNTDDPHYAEKVGHVIGIEGDDTAVVEFDPTWIAELPISDLLVLL